jgi:hypothetical protein
MTTEQINIAIAEACGWTDINVPGYCHDLNAMHEAENVLDTETEDNITGSYSAYAQCLAWAGGYSATARQRAEAFLRAIGKWNDQDHESPEHGGDSK